MELQCDVCYVNFDLNDHRPKSLPCGHTICKECVENPALHRKCPTCRKGLGRNTQGLPDNIIVLKMLEDGAPPRKKSKKEDSAVPQLQRGVDAARKVVEQLQQVVPLAVEALNHQLDSAVEQLRQMEEALVQREAAGGEAPPPYLTEQLHLAAQLEHSLRLLTTTKCSVVAEEEDGAAWRASVQPGGVGDVLRMLFVQLQADGQLEKVDEVAAPATCAAYVGPPLFSTLRIGKNDLDGGRLNVNEMLRNRERILNIRCISNLKGEGSEQLLSVLAPQLEDLQISDLVTSRAMEEVQKMTALKRLKVACNKDVTDYPPLPLQLEELWINTPCESQLRCVERMPGLRSLCVWNYCAPDITFTPSRVGALVWLGVTFPRSRKATMLSLIRSYASSLQELVVVCSVSDEGAGKPWYFPDLGQDLAASGLVGLRRLVLKRPVEFPCTDNVAACLRQRQSLRRILSLAFNVDCETCKVSEVLTV